ncbi:hypothetical protein [Frigidibacter sp. SD6-1]|uniref:hypothetical protein n=1 Tax=Frigidibacter sp. SD6-1 TaxID=3032581 RepID=UPI0024E00E89|nr:hypothetical protein [Frigidibacter sp. SD6-1]
MRKADIFPDRESWDDFLLELKKNTIPYEIVTPSAGDRIIELADKYHDFKKNKFYLTEVDHNAKVVLPESSQEVKDIFAETEIASPGELIYVLAEPWASGVAVDGRDVPTVLMAAAENLMLGMNILAIDCHHQLIAVIRLDLLTMLVPLDLRRKPTSSQAAD